MCYTAYEYDSVGNMTNKNGNMRTKVKSYKNLMNNNAQPTLGIKTASELSENQSYEYFTYNVFNQLTKYSRKGTNAVYTYLPNGYRGTKTVNGIKTGFIWDGDNIGVEINSNNEPTNVLFRGRNLIRDSKGNNYVYDNHGDVTSILNDSGTKTKEYDYNAFGIVESETNINTYNPWQYCGEYRDEESGLIYLRNRYYDSDSGRFINEDTHWNVDNMIYGDNGYDEDEIKYPDIESITESSNLYTYCLNNPVSYIDIFGLDGILLTNENGVPVGSGGSNTNMGHSAALVQNEEGKWFYFSCGEGYIQFGEVSSDYMTDLKTFSDRYYKGQYYTTATYIKGDFTESYNYFKDYADTYGTGVFDPNNGARQGNSNYNFVTQNCAVVATIGLNKGKLSDGTLVGTLTGTQALPLSARTIYKNTFYNSCFTYNEYSATIKNELSNTFVITHPFKHAMLKKLL